MSARFEICRGDDGWWARFRAANGRVVWVTETYTRRRAAERAMAVLGECLSPYRAYRIEVREVDEREGS